MALGAFIAGLLLAETEYRRAIEAMIDPFKGLLLGVFFVSVGMALDVTQLARKRPADPRRRRRPDRRQGGVIAALGAAFRLARPVALETALLLGPGGEFAFVILAGAVVAGLVPEPIGQFGLGRRDGVDDRHPGARAHRAAAFAGGSKARRARPGPSRCRRPRRAA